MNIYSNSLTASYNQSVAYGGALPAQMGAVAQPVSFGNSTLGADASLLNSFNLAQNGGGNVLSFGAPSVATLGGGFGGQDLSMLGGLNGLNGLNGGLMQTSVASSGLMAGAAPQYVAMPYPPQQPAVDNSALVNLCMALISKLSGDDEGCNHTHKVAYRDEVEPQQVAAAEQEDEEPFFLHEKLEKASFGKTIKDMF